MPDPYPAIHSILSPHTLADELLPQYGLGPIKSADYYSGGFNDTYRFQDVSGEVYYMRIYRREWRSLADIQYEIDLLLHLQRKGFPAIRPVPRLDGAHYSSLAAPEGLRYALLTGAAPGSVIDHTENYQQTVPAFARAAAEMHNALDDFQSEHPRFHLDLEHLIDKPLRLIEPFLTPYPEWWDFLQRLAEFVHQAIESLGIENLEWGACHGDLQGYHAMVDEQGNLTLFDFDCGGPGFRAYELAVFRWVTRLNETETDWWQPYIETYQAHRPVAAVDLAAIPYFTACRFIWHLGVHAENSYDWGISFLNREYYANKIKQLRSLAADYGWPLT